MGFCDKEISSDRIAVVNSWSEQSPGHIHLRDLADAVKAGIRLAGAMPFEMNVLGPCSGLAGNRHDASYYDLPQREVILNSIEVGLKAAWCDGWVGLCTCDKIVPAMLMAAIRLDKPCLIVTGGPMLTGDYNNDWMAVGKGLAVVYPQMLSGTITEEGLESIICEAGYCSGSCAEMTTGNSMQIMTEALGLALPYTSTIPAVAARRKIAAKESGMQIVKLVKDKIRPSQIITEEAIKNAIAVDMAVGGGTNSIIHIQALAWEGRLNITLDTWDEYSRIVPTLCSIAPAGPHSLIDFHKAGGVPGVMNEIGDLLSLDCMTVSGETVSENIKGWKSRNGEVIRPLNMAIENQGAIAILKGNLAPRGAIIRRTIVKEKRLLQKRYTAKVFDNFEHALAAIYEGKNRSIQAGDAVICRYEGPRGGPGMAEVLSVVTALNATGAKEVAVITDGRFSGLTSNFPAICHVCPEAQIGGPLAIVQDGDVIRLDVPQRLLELEVTESEIKRRLRNWRLPDLKHKDGVLTIYSKLSLQADNGAGWETRI